MILVREVFQVKFGHMDAVLAALKESMEDMMGPDTSGRVMTDASGQMFTLVFESTAESIDAYMNMMRAGFDQPEMEASMNSMMQHVESGRREFYTIEWESGR